MNVRNVHERVLAVPAVRVGALLDSLASEEDGLWPRDRWPAMRFDRPLGVGAVGGHGPIRYWVEAYDPGRRVRFRFTAPRGIEGTHRFEVEAVDGPEAPGGGQARLRHVVEMRTSGPALLTWPLLFRPLHDALLEDALDRAERGVGGSPRPRGWSPWVRVLRWLLSRGRSAS